MVIYIEIRKIEKDFGADRWAIRFGDIAGSTDMHNISKADLIKAVISEVEEEAKKLDDEQTNETIMSEVFDKFVEGVELKISKKYSDSNTNAICYNFKEELKKKLLGDKSSKE